MGALDLKWPRFNAGLAMAAGAVALSVLPRTGQADSAWSPAGACSVATVGVDTSQATMWMGFGLGKTWGQVFKADATLIQSITIWRIANPDTVLDPLILYISEVDSTGKPLLHDLLLDGMPLIVPVGEVPGRPIAYRYAFDPPFALPAPGKYWFGVKEGWCDFTLAILMDSTDVYPDGAAWMAVPNLECIGVGRSPWSYGGRFDMVFTVEFCLPSVPTRPVTWGRLKALYR